MLFGNLNSLAMEPMGHVAGLAAAIIGFMSTLISMSIGTIIGQYYNGTLLPLSTGFFITGLFTLVTMALAEKKSPY